MSSHFIFTSDVQSLANGAFLVELREPIQNKTELLKWLALKLNFPEYFGNNWDALSACLRDLDWIANRRVVIFHNVVPLTDNPGEARTYLRILDDAIGDWGRSNQEHEMIGAFHDDLVGTVKGLLSYA